MIIGYVYVGVEGHINDPTIQTSNPTPTFSELSPVIGLFLSIPAIFFVFDGFYSTAGLQTEMREPKKTSVAMLIGLCAVSVIDILISISLMISGQGSLSGLRVFFDQHHCG
ncbi:MAG: APC family permease [Mycoplasmoidaceae bacterium]|nr:APC family permease [Mycoplasmoidaceae bacterium]